MDIIAHMNVIQLTVAIYAVYCTRRYNWKKAWLLTWIPITVMVMMYKNSEAHTHPEYANDEDEELHRAYYQYNST